MTQGFANAVYDTEWLNVMLWVAENSGIWYGSSLSITNKGKEKTKTPVKCCTGIELTCSNDCNDLRKII